MNVAIGLVAGEQIDTRFYLSMVDTFNALRDRKWPAHDATSFPVVISGPLLSYARGRLAGLFLEEEGLDALVMLDTDMVFKPETIYEMVESFTQLREHVPEAGVMGGLAFTCGNIRDQRIMPTLWFANQERPQDIHQSLTYPKTPGWVEVESTGAACIIVAREVLERMATLNPFHHVPIANWRYLAHNVMAMDDEEKAAEEIKQAVWAADQLGEDMSFCARVRDLGYRIYVDTRLVFDHMKVMPIGPSEHHQQLLALEKK